MPRPAFDRWNRSRADFETGRPIPQAHSHCRSCMPSCGVRASSQRRIPGPLSFSLGDRSRSSQSRWPTRWRGSLGRCWPRAGPTERPNSWQPDKELGNGRMRLRPCVHRTAGVMTTLMRNGRDRRLEKPVKCHARKERVFLVGTRSADHSGPAAIAAAFKGRIHGCTRTLR